MLDRLIDIFSNPPQAQQDLHPQWRSPPPDVRALYNNKVGPLVIEVCGMMPCSGKTQLLYYIAAATVLPEAYEGIKLGGKQGAVVWLDTGSRFDICRLLSVLRSIAMRQGSAPFSPAQLEAITSESLENIHIFNPQSSAALLSTSKTIQNYLFSFNRHYSSGRPLSTLIINNISAFLHQDRLDTDSYYNVDAISTNTPATQIGYNSFVQRYRDLVNVLREIQATFSCTVIAGNVALSALQPGMIGPTVRPHLPPAWTSFCTLKLLVARGKTPKFGPGISAEEAAGEADARRNAVRKSGFRVWVDSWEGKNWGSDVREALETLCRCGGFSFSADGTGIRLEEPLTDEQKTLMPDST